MSEKIKEDEKRIDKKYSKKDYDKIKSKIDYEIN